MKPLVLSNASVASTAAAAPRDGVVQVDAMGMAGNETIATMLSRLGISAVAQAVQAFVIVVPSVIGGEEVAIPTGTASLNIDGCEQVGDWAKAILLSANPPTANVRIYEGPTLHRKAEVHVDQLRAMPGGLGKARMKKLLTQRCNKGWPTSLG